MRILYGVCSEGMGHVTRSVVVAAHLVRQGHEVTFAASEAALAHLTSRCPGSRALPLVGLQCIMARHTVLPVGSFFANLSMQLRGAVKNLASFLDMRLSTPDLVVSDFEPGSARYATLTGTPLLAIDNIHFLTRCSHPAAVVEGRDEWAKRLMVPLVDHMVPGAARYLVTSFAQAVVCQPHTALHLPILRPEVLAAKGKVLEDEHVIVYFNAKAGHAQIVQALGNVPGQSFRYYGVPGVTVESTRGNVTLCPFSDSLFVRDLASSRAVVGGAGFTLMSEALYLGKPMLAVPFANQYEQILNANYLARLGYGERCDDVTPAGVGAFLGRTSFYSKRAARFEHDGNAALLSAVDEAIAA